MYEKNEVHELTTPSSQMFGLVKTRPQGMRCSRGAAGPADPATARLPRMYCRSASFTYG
jgi:hypothetical protein